MIAKARRALRECVCEGMRRGRKESVSVSESVRVRLGVWKAWRKRVGRIRHGAVLGPGDVGG